MEIKVREIRQGNKVGRDETWHLLLMTLALNLQYKVNCTLCSVREESRTTSTHSLEKQIPGEQEGVACANL